MDFENDWKYDMKRLVLSLLVGACGFFLAWGGWHLYQDHQNWHILLNQLQLEQQKQAASPK